MTRLSLTAAATLWLVAFPLVCHAEDDPAPVVRNGEAFVLHDAVARTWTVGNAMIEYVVGLDRNGLLRPVRLVNRLSGYDWQIATTAADGTVTIDGTPRQLGSRTGLSYLEFRSDTPAGGVELALVFDDRAKQARVVRHYLCYPSAPVIEVYTTVESLSTVTPVVTSDLNAFQVSVASGEVTWLTGLNAAPELGGSFTLHREAIAAGGRLDLGASGRSTERAVPHVLIDRAVAGSDGEGARTETFFGGLMWSGAWTLAIEPAGARLRATLGLAPMTTTVRPGQHVDSPHGYFGVASTIAIKPASAVRAFIEHGVRGGRPFQSLVTLNTWFVHGAWIDETSMMREVDNAAELGAEVFVLDAGWWSGAGERGHGDFHSGLGQWSADPERFPSGIAPLADYARSKGLRFGLWVEPERIALDLVNLDGSVPEVWLAMRDGRRDPGVPVEEETTAQICLGSPEARAWLLERLVAIIDEVRPEYLKWDNNFWIDCNRTDHGHGAADGNFAHVNGLYELLAQLRERYPDLIIENCSGGGHRLDVGMARYADVAWMDDRTAPSAHVRHNIEGLSSLFPAAYLFSFVLSDPVDEPAPATARAADRASSDAGMDDLLLLMRSRMPAVLGLGDGALAGREEAAREIATYKRLREIQRHATSGLLSGQVIGRGDAPAWDVIQQVSDESGDAVIFAYQVDPASESVLVRPTWLDPERTYRVESVDAGFIGQARGADLMEQGIEIVDSPLSDAHILILQILPPEPPGDASAMRTAGGKR